VSCIAILTADIHVFSINMRHIAAYKRRDAEPCIRMSQRNKMQTDSFWSIHVQCSYILYWFAKISNELWHQTDRHIRNICYKYLSQYVFVSMKAACLLFIWHVCLRVSTLTQATAMKFDYVFSARRATETRKSRLKLLGVNRINTQCWTREKFPAHRIMVLGNAF